MTLTELIYELSQLSSGEKLHVVQFLVNDLAAEDQAVNFMMDQEFEIWSPYDSKATAAGLLQMLEEDKQSRHG